MSSSSTRAPRRIWISTPRSSSQKQAELPPNIKLAIDPNYKMTSLYGLRWDAAHETAYPSTFVLDVQGKILFEKISHSHGDRTTAADVLAQLATK
jgi:hypothetical protein